MRNIKRFLITGAAGSVGRALVRRLVMLGHTVCAFDNSEDGMFNLKKEYETSDYAKLLRYFLGDIRDKQRLVTSLEGVDVVIHCAALKHVEMSELNPIEAINTNIEGTKNVVQACIDTNVSRAVLTSSDKAVNPSSTMGTTKLISEKLFISANNLVGSKNLRFSVVRFGNVLNSNGSVVKIFKDCYDNSLPFLLTEENMTRFFLTMREAEELCLYAVNHSVGGEIFINNMGSANIKKIAQAIAASEDVNISIIGAKPGEKLWEELSTDIEATRTILMNGVYVVLPDIKLFTNESIREVIHEKYKDIKPIGAMLTSKTDDLSWKKIRKIFFENEILQENK